MAKAAPNILLITADQLRYDCVGSSGINPVDTPHLDLLAQSGMTFTNAYSHLPVCCPARQSLLHGRRPESFGALWNYNGALPVASLQPDAFTWSRSLAENGYRSAFLGKWGVHPKLDAAAFGYDVYIGEEEYSRFRKSRYPNVNYTRGYFGETNPIPVEDSATHWFADRAVEQLNRLRSGGGPWHLALHFAEPHLPCRPSGRFAEMYDPGSVKEWPGFKETFEGKPYIQRQQLYNWGIENYTWDDWAPIVARYYGIVSQMDEAVGRVLQAVEADSENTIVIFTSDHGDMCGSHRMMDKHYVLYDDVVRVPLIIRWKGTIAENSVCNDFVYNFLDLPPTIMELLGIQGPSFHGQSLLPLLTGKNNGEQWRDFVVSTYNGQQFGLYTQRMIRTKHWKYIWNPTDTDELYDLRSDPAELVNRIGDENAAGIVKELRIKLYEQLRLDDDGLVLNEWMRGQLLNGTKLITH